MDNLMFDLFDNALLRLLLVISGDDMHDIAVANADDQEAIQLEAVVN